MTRPATVALLALLLLAVPAWPIEVEFRPMEPDPINSPMMRPVGPRVEVPPTQIEPVTGAPSVEVRTEGQVGVFFFVRRELGRVAVRQGQELKVFRLSPLGPMIPEDLRPGQKVEIRHSGNVLRSLRVL